MKKLNTMKLQIKSALHATFSGYANSQQLLTTFLLFTPIIAAIVVYCLTHHLSR